jgi:hypothetical protein
VRPARRSARPAQAHRAALTGTATLAAGLALLLATACGSGGGTTQREPAACNGSPALCGRRLDEVVFPGTHNSFAASDEPGWHFANQRYGMPRQLKDGIRAFLIDVHYGVYDARTKRVRTDLTAEGSDRNKVAKQVPSSALRIADQVAGTVGLGSLSGTPKLYLCHTLCELGAEPLQRELKGIGRFLADHPDQLLIVVVEDYVPPGAIDSAVREAGLQRYVATLPTGEPLPTLGALIEHGQRLLVFAEEKGGTPSWYMPAFTYIEDTPLGATLPTQLSCKRYRGNPDSPLLLINHWIPPFPPSATKNAAIGRAAFLRDRAERCMRERDRRGAILAVDFYERTSVVAVAKELNARDR